MPKQKLKRFELNKHFERLFQPDAKSLLEKPHPFIGKWAQTVFKNNNPITLEIGCGRGEYTTELAKMYPGQNFIGLDIKGSRLYCGALAIHSLNLNNAAFVRTLANFCNSIFYKREFDS